MPFRVRFSLQICSEVERVGLLGKEVEVKLQEGWATIATAASEGIEASSPSTSGLVLPYGPVAESQVTQPAPKLNIKRFGHSTLVQVQCEIGPERGKVIAVYREGKPPSPCE